MRSRSYLLAAILGLVFSSGAGAQQISRELAAELIAEANQIRSADITIGPIHSVERKMDTTITLLGGVCVTFIAPEIKDGRRRRVTLTRTFFYDKEWGWYPYALETDRGGDVIDIVSQHKGRLILRGLTGFHSTSRRPECEFGPFLWTGIRKNAHLFAEMSTFSGSIEGCELQEIPVESFGYQELRRLRFAELRKPLGLEWTKAEGEADRLDRHFGLYREGVPVGTVVVAAIGSGLAKLRQIAVSKAEQGRGLGRCLMDAVESLLAGEGVTQVELHARLEVAGFYDSLGYRRQGELFEEIGIPHVKMVKSLKRGGSA
jgi:ribosomal protein S18 acetylase RimI-like enzyme